MADNPKISQIKLPNGSTYDIKDNISGYTNNTGTITSVKTTAGAHTTINVSSGAAEFNVPTKTSHLTNDSGFLTSSDIASVLTYKGTKASVANLPSTGNKTGDVWHITADGSEYAWDGSIWQELGTAIDLSGYATKATTLSGYGITDAKIENGTITLGSNSITPLTSFTETDPVFSASAAADITSTDISNWNAKVSDDHKWNDVSLAHGFNVGSDNDYYVPIMGTIDATTANFNKVSKTPQNYAIAKYGSGAYLYSTTPSANDNSTKVATTAYVDAAIPKVYSSTNTGGYLTMATLPIYDGTVV